MYLKIAKYIAVFIALAYIYHHTPCLLVKNELLFITLGLLIYHFASNLATEHYDAYDDGECESETDEDGISHNKCEDKKKTKMTDVQILNHVNNIIKNLDDEKALNAIFDAILLEKDPKKRKELMTLFEMVIDDPEMATKLTSKSPKHVLQTAILASENPDYFADIDSESEDSKDDFHEEPSMPAPTTKFGKAINVANAGKIVNGVKVGKGGKVLNGNQTKAINAKTIKAMKKDDIIAKAKSDIVALNITADELNEGKLDNAALRTNASRVNASRTNKSEYKDALNMANNTATQSQGNSNVGTTPCDAQLSKVMNKIAGLEAALEAAINSKSKTDVKAAMPEFLRKMMDKNKYIDRDGLVRNALTGDMKYSQIDPGRYQPPVQPGEDDKWDHAHYSILPPSVWRPRRQSDARDQFQEGNCPVCPMQTTGNTTNLAEWNDSRYVIGSDNISVDYIKELNRRKI